MLTTYYNKLYEAIKSASQQLWKHHFPSLSLFSPLLQRINIKLTQEQAIVVLLFKTVSDFLLLTFLFIEIF